jgi:hypothetical protein
VKIDRRNNIIEFGGQRFSFTLLPALAPSSEPSE